jgi:hypothetical protein
MEVKNMNNPVDPRKIPLFIERLAKAGYLLDVECSKREITTGVLLNIRLSPSVRPD